MGLPHWVTAEHTGILATFPSFGSVRVVTSSSDQVVAAEPIRRTSASNLKIDPLCGTSTDTRKCGLERTGWVLVLTRAHRPPLASEVVYKAKSTACLLDRTI